MEPALSAAQLAWPAPPGNGRVRGLILKHEAFDELEHQARYGMLPLSWGSLSTEDVYAAPLELLLVRQLADDEQAKLLRFRYNRLTEEFAKEFAIRTAALPGPFGLHHPNFWPDFDALPEAKALNGALLDLAASSEFRKEQARHYGMLLARAFFKTASEEVLLDRFPQEVVKCIEQFLTDGPSTVWPFGIVSPKLPPWLDPCDGKPDRPFFLVGELARLAPKLGSVQICRGLEEIQFWPALPDSSSPATESASEPEASVV